LVMYDRDYMSDHFVKLLVNPEIAFADTTLEILKTGGSSTVAKIDIDGRSIVVKRYNIKDIWHWARRTLRSTRAATSWKLANTLRLFGVATPKPIAFIEKRFLGFRSKSYFVMEYIKGPNLFDYFANYQPNDLHLEKVAVKVVTLLKNITKMKMSHGDLKATNILISNDQPILLDLDGMKQYTTLSKANRVYKTEIKRFMKNWDRQPAVKALFERLV
jgi:tRNA A-37 threonylcarbamoyl transferase component Bud32